MPQSPQSFQTSLTCYVTASVYSAVTQPQTSGFPINGRRPAGPRIIESSKGELQPSANGYVDTANNSLQNASLPSVGAQAAEPAAPPQTSKVQYKVDGIDGTADARSGNSLHVMCGPLLNYHGMIAEVTETVWHGSVLLVVGPGMQIPHLELRNRGPAGQRDAPKAEGFFSRAEMSTAVEGVKLYSDPVKTFWRFALRIPLSTAETTWEYTIQICILDLRFLQAHHGNSWCLLSLSQCV